MGMRKFMDNLKPTFSEGGKLGFLASTFDAFETFLFVPNTTTARGAHIRDVNDMKRTMIVVVAALMPRPCCSVSTTPATSTTSRRVCSPSSGPRCGSVS